MQDLINLQALMIFSIKANLHWSPKDFEKIEDDELTKRRFSNWEDMKGGKKYDQKPGGDKFDSPTGG